MIAVVGVLEVVLADGVFEEGGDGLLAVVEVHETADLARHVRLVALILEIAAELHRGVRLGKVLVGEVTGGGDLSLGHAESLLEGDLRVLPGGGDAKALEVGGRLDRLGADRGAGLGGRGLAGRNARAGRPEARTAGMTQDEAMAAIVRV